MGHTDIQAYLFNAVNILLLKTAWPTILKTFKTLNSNLPSAEFGENWPSGSEKKALFVVNVFSILLCYILLERSVVVHLSRLKFLSPKDALYHFLYQLFFFYIGLVDLNGRF